MRKYVRKLQATEATYTDPYPVSPATYCKHHVCSMSEACGIPMVG